jgi:hyperosmotically inducible protein
MDSGKGLLCTLMIAVACVTGGCELFLIGGAATAGYKLSTDQKTVSEAFDDSVITGSVKTRLMEDRMVRSMSIDVDTNLGEVTLLGYVRSQEEIDRAVIIAKGVPGVTKVMSLLRVRTTE